MSVNDPDVAPYPELTFDEFVAELVRAGWTRLAAEAEWERFKKPVRLCDLEW